MIELNKKQEQQRRILPFITEMIDKDDLAGCFMILAKTDGTFLSIRMNGNVPSHIMVGMIEQEQCKMALGLHTGENIL
jgi:hypothetical protein